MGDKKAALSAVVKLLVVDDHAVVRLGVSQALQSNPMLKIIGTAENGDQAIDIARKNRPDVILMDQTMPGMNGIETMRRILEFDDSIKVIIFTASVDKRTAMEAVDAGAHGIMSKGADTETLVGAIFTAFSGRYYIDPDLAHLITTKSEDSARFEALSDEELEVAMLLASGESIEEIAEITKLGTEEVNGISQQILGKLRLKNAVELAHFMLGRGEL